MTTLGAGFTALSGLHAMVGYDWPRWPAGQLTVVASVG
jgi:hypothetical protein